MTKKLMLLIVLAVSVLSIIVIAVWGTLPESQNQQSITEIIINDYDINDTGDKIINVIDIVTSDNPYYTLNYSYLPMEAAFDFNVTSSYEGVTLLLDEINQKILVNFSSNEAIGQNVTIRITDQKTSNYDEITLIFKVPDIIVGN